LRCYINLPAMRATRGDDIRPLLEMAVEGIRLARRAAASSVVCWLSGNIAGFLMELGRLDEALDYQDEAVGMAEGHVSGNVVVALADRARLHRLRGEVDAALRDEARLGGLAGAPEPQVAFHRCAGIAETEWQTDPQAALDTLALMLADDTLAIEERGKVAHQVGRMALRLGDGARLRQAAEIRRALGHAGGPTYELKQAWDESLSDGSAGLNTELVARRFEELGMVVSAADAWADAALLAARADRETDALERAAELCDGIGMHPLLGPLPETRWLEPAKPTGSAPGA
jgi:hypothetical protein